MSDPIIYIAVVLAAIVALAALGLWMFSQMFDTNEKPEPADHGNTPKPPPEPEH